jgi:hypothetical protein
MGCVFDEIRKLRGVLAEVEIGTEFSRKGPRLREKSEDGFKVRNAEDYTEIPKKQKEALLRAENQKYTLNEQNVDVVRKLFGVDGYKIKELEETIQNAEARIRSGVNIEKARAALDGAKKELDGMKYSTAMSLLKGLGWKDPSSEHVDFRDNIRSKNREVIGSISDIIDLSNRVGDRGIYFDYFFSKNGRFFIDSGTVNPQTDKLHRFLVDSEDSKVVVDDSNRDVFNLAVVQAFDGSDIESLVIDGIEVKDLGAIDKQSKEASLQDFENIVNSEKVQIAIEELKNGVYDGAVVDIMSQVDHPSHVLMALRELAKYREDVEFETNMTMETDAVTSGFILGLLTNPVLSFGKLKKWLAKGGVWIGGTDEESFGAYNGKRDADGNKVNSDSYETGAVLATAELGSVPEWLSDVVGKIDRKFMKSPLMTFIYGSSIENIKSSVAVSKADEMVKKLASGKIEEARKVLVAMKKLGIIGVDHSKSSDEVIARQQKVFREASMADRNNGSAGAKLREFHVKITDEVKKTYGEAVGRALENEFAEVVDMRKLVNKSFVLMYEEYAKEYNSRIGKVENLTKQKRDEILAEMVKEGRVPGLMGVLAENIGEKVVVAKLGREFKLEYQVSSKIGGSKGRNVNPLVRELQESPASGAVVTIHTLDGSIMTDMIENENGLGIHDAWLGGIGSAVESASRYSRSTWNRTQQYDMLNRIVEALKKLDNKKADILVKALDTYVEKVAGNKELMAESRVDIEHMSMPGSKVSVGGEKKLADVNEMVKVESKIEDSIIQAKELEAIRNESLKKECII